MQVHVFEEGAGVGAGVGGGVAGGVGGGVGVGPVQPEPLQLYALFGFPQTGQSQLAGNCSNGKPPPSFFR